MVFDDLPRVEMRPVARGVGVVGNCDGESSRTGGSKGGVDAEIGRTTGDDQLGDGVAVEERLESGVQERVARRFLFDHVAGRAVELIEEVPGVAVSGESFARVGVLDEYDRPPWANATRELVDTGDSARGIVARRRSGEAAVLHVDDQQGDHGELLATGERRQHYPIERGVRRGAVALSVQSADGRHAAFRKAAGEGFVCYHRGLHFSRIAPPAVLVADLHSHSRASDGLLSSAEVAQRAVANGVELFALTDHDDLGGLRAARDIAEQSSMRFIDGVEISIEWGGLQVHIVGLDFDPQNAALNEGLATIRSGRIDRARRMSAELEKIGIGGCFEGAMRHTENPSLISRSHFARYLVEAGVCKDVRSVFESYLVPGKPGYVTHHWATLAESVGWIVGAGGVAVIAHPGRYKFSRLEMRNLLDEFKQCGGLAIEVVSGSHSQDNINQFARLAREYGFLASCGSDFHGPEESYIDLGRTPPLPDGLKPVWEAF